MNIEIKYNASYPSLCSGNLVVIIDGNTWNFPENCLISGGSVSISLGFIDDYDEILEGEWSIEKWPDNFPEDLKEAVIREVNNQIEWGCCGGCI